MTKEHFGNPFLTHTPNLILKDFLFGSLEISEGGKKGPSNRATVQFLSKTNKPAPHPPLEQWHLALAAHGNHMGTLKSTDAHPPAQGESYLIGL